MTMKKIITGGAPFAAHKEMKAKANHFSLPKRALQVNHNRQEQTYKSKLQSTRMIIKDYDDDDSRVEFFLRVGKHTKNIFF